MRLHDPSLSKKFFRCPVEVEKILLNDSKIYGKREPNKGGNRQGYSYEHNGIVHVTCERSVKTITAFVKDNKVRGLMYFNVKLCSLKFTHEHTHTYPHSHIRTHTVFQLIL